ncbi:alpha/beta fold hydrolase [Amycolatopsis jejuensis]|uniref:alpha/beta fold hydrolase n=1 Tax=Amycolatopsis jejuensis TaxID=330084 RepID=UPI00068A1501|nr:alpha/beta hydrolase [Amycolatopsis jejuensis]
MTQHARRSARGRSGELSYLDWPGSGTPVLYLHPVNTAAEVWTDVVAELGGPALAVDYRAHGRSEPGGPYLPADYAADALAVLDTAGVERAHLVCGSIGGAVSVELAAAAPDRVASIAAFGAALRVSWGPELLDEAEAGLRELGVRAWFARHGGEILGPRSRPDAADRLVELASGGRNGDRDTDTVVQVLRSTFGDADSRPAAAVVAAAPPPARVFVGSHDPTCPPERARELAAGLNAEVRVLDGIGHLPMLEDPAGTAAAVREFHASSENR